MQTVVRLDYACGEAHPTPTKQKWKWAETMEFSLKLQNFRQAGRLIPHGLPALSLRSLLPGVRTRRTNRIDRECLPESLRRDLGLIDARGSQPCGAEWRAAVFSFPPRGL